MARGMDLEPAALGAEQSNTSLAFGQALILKLFRKIESGVNPEVELTALLAEQGFEHAPAPAGVLEYRPTSGSPATLGVLQGYVANEGNAWSFALDELGRFLEGALARDDGPPRLPAPEATAADQPGVAHDLVGPFLEVARLLGARTAELHLSLANAPAGDAPERFSALQQRGLLQSMRTLVRQTFRSVRRAGAGHGAAGRIADREDDVMAAVHELLENRLGGMQTRVHGDLHLGQVLWTGRDVVLIDFEGEPGRTLGQRRLKRSPARDVAGMLRSFHYAAYAGLYQECGRDDPTGGLAEGWVRFWRACVSAAYLHGYRDAVGESPIVPADDGEFGRLVRLFAIEKCVYEIGYELNSRPDWLHIPVLGLEELLEG
jgi:maltose alpha-D-glucosyltransferase/alpha-amylase